MALTCPHCTVQIRGHIHRCPACGTWSFIEADACPGCGAPVPDTEDTTRQDAPPTPKVHPHKPVHQFAHPCPIEPPQSHGKRRKGKGWLHILLNLSTAILCLAAATYGAYRYQLSREEQQAAIRQELAQRIAEDEEANAQKLYQAQQDSTFWAQTLKTKTIEAAHEYIAKYPEGIFIDEAYMLIEELQRRAVTKTERAHIIGVVDNRLAQLREQFIKSGKRTAKDIQYRVPDTLLISKKHLNRDSILYTVSGKVLKITVPTGKAAPDTSTIELHMTMDKYKNVLESNIGATAKR